MHSLLKKDAHFIWTSDTQKEMDELKEAIARATLLQHFNPAIEVVIETDASLKGLGAVLLQEGQPIRFLSKTLTSADKLQQH